MFSSDDCPLPVAGSGQWGGQAHDTYQRTGRTLDLMYLCGGGIVSHPGGPGAGVKAVKQAWEAAVAGIPLELYAKRAPGTGTVHCHICRWKRRMSRLISYYGDDFTGSTDVMEALASHGVDTVLFTRMPSAEEFAPYKDHSAIGLAGISRSQPPAWMDENLPASYAWLKIVESNVLPLQGLFDLLIRLHTWAASDERPISGRRFSPNIWCRS